jgi:uncharacterized protein YneF (UPF0154 family)
MNNKLILSAMGLMLGCGAISGYFLARWDIQSNLPTGTAIAANMPNTKRAQLEQKYTICTGSKPDSKALARFDDSALNDLVYQVCAQNS